MSLPTNDEVKLTTSRESITETRAGAYCLEMRDQQTVTVLSLRVDACVDEREWAVFACWQTATRPALCVHCKQLPHAGVGR